MGVVLHHLDISSRGGAVMGDGCGSHACIGSLHSVWNRMFIYCEEVGCPAAVQLDACT